MRRSFLSAGIAAAVLSVPTVASASSWELDISHSTLSFVVRHLTVTDIRGQFNKATGVLELNELDPAKSTVQTTIEVASVDTSSEDRDKHLRSPDFFDVNNHPTIQFKSRRITKARAGYKVVGDLTIRGVTREVVLDATAPGPVIKDPFGFYRTGFTSSTKINRKDFGVKFHKVLDNGGLAVGDEVRIQLELQFMRKTPPTTASTAGDKQP